TWCWRTSSVLFQACTDTRHGVSIVTEEHATAVSSADRSGVGRTIPRHKSKAARTPCSSLYGGRPQRAGDSLFAEGPAESERALVLCGSDCSPHQRTGVAPDPARHT